MLLQALVCRCQRPDLNFPTVHARRTQSLQRHTKLQAANLCLCELIGMVCAALRWLFQCMRRCCTRAPNQNRSVQTNHEPTMLIRSGQSEGLEVSCSKLSSELKMMQCARRSFHQPHNLRDFGDVLTSVTSSLTSSSSNSRSGANSSSNLHPSITIVH